MKRKKINSLKISNLFFIVILMILVFSFKTVFSMEIKKLVRVEKDKVYLSDILITENKDIINKALEIQVAFSPEAGGEKYINKDYLKLKLKQLKLKAVDEIEIPDTIIIVREYQTVDKEIIKNIIEGKIKQLYQDKTIVITVNEEEKLKLPLGKIDIEISDNRLDGNRMGSFNVFSSLKIDKEMIKRVSCNIEIGEIREITVLKRDVVKGDIFTEDSFEKIEKIFYDDLKKNENIAPKKFYGKIFKKTMKKGDTFSENDFEKKKIFKRNERVIIYIEKNGIYLKTIGKALEDGYEGENVSVLNEKTKKIIVGRVNSNGSVEVEF